MLRRLQPYWLLACMCLLSRRRFFWQAAWLSFTADEPSHFAAGYAYWLNKDYLFPSDTPPLIRIVSGWIPPALGGPRPETMHSWPSRNAYMIGSEIVSALPARHARVVIAAVALIVIWIWARELFGPGGAGALAVCAAAEPTLTGHGALIKSDVPAAAIAVLFGYMAWRYWRRPSLQRFVAMSAALTGAILTKFTLLALIPIAIGIG